MLWGRQTFQGPSRLTLGPVLASTGLEVYKMGSSAAGGPALLCAALKTSLADHSCPGLLICHYWHSGEWVRWPAALSNFRHRKILVCGWARFQSLILCDVLSLDLSRFDHGGPIQL